MTIRWSPRTIHLHSQGATSPPVNRFQWYSVCSIVPFPQYCCMLHFHATTAVSLAMASIVAATQFPGVSISHSTFRDATAVMQNNLSPGSNVPSARLVVTLGMVHPSRHHASHPPLRKRMLNARESTATGLVALVILKITCIEGNEPIDSTEETRPTIGEGLEVSNVDPSPSAGTL